MQPLNERQSPLSAASFFFWIGVAMLGAVWIGTPARKDQAILLFRGWYPGIFRLAAGRPPDAVRLDRAVNSMLLSRHWLVADKRAPRALESVWGWGGEFMREKFHHSVTPSIARWEKHKRDSRPPRIPEPSIKKVQDFIFYEFSPPPAASRFGDFVVWDWENSQEESAAASPWRLQWALSGAPFFSEDRILLLAPEPRPGKKHFRLRADMRSIPEWIADENVFAFRLAAPPGALDRQAKPPFPRSRDEGENP